MSNVTTDAIAFNLPPGGEMNWLTNMSLLLQGFSKAVDTLAILIILMRASQSISYPFSFFAGHKPQKLMQIKCERHNITHQNTITKSNPLECCVFCCSALIWHKKHRKITSNNNLSMLIYKPKLSL